MVKICHGEVIRDGKTQKYEKYCLRLDKVSKTKENLAKVISKFEKLCNGDISEGAKIDKLYLHNNLEIKYYGYDERNNIRPGYSIAEFGFLTIIAGNEVFVYNQEELKELLNGLCLGEEELCREKVLVKKSL